MPVDGYQFCVYETLWTTAVMYCEMSYCNTRRHAGSRGCVAYHTAGQIAAVIITGYPRNAMRYRSGNQLGRDCV
jgi:hypothetical protein